MNEVVTEEYKGYETFLVEVKKRVQIAQIRAVLAVNSEMVLLYWHIGHDISQRMQEHGWGTKIVDRLSTDLRREFPSVQGFSPRNLRYMRSFAETWIDESILQAVLAKLTWYHNIALLEKLSSPEERLWYAQATYENGWSRNILVHQIESKLYARQGKAVTNFGRAHERDLEKGLLEHIRKFLLELGTGFAFLGSQYHLEFAGEDYYLDLLFYHVKLRCYVIIELKSGKFLPEYAGKMNFYLAVADDILRNPDDAPTIGLILCKERNAITVEYTLRGVQTPIGVSGYQIMESLPENLKNSLPTVAQLEAEFAEIKESKQ
jgi:predicted nuclease of restriction endonuclease-like (RecB) superfamily